MNKTLLGFMSVAVMATTVMAQGAEAQKQTPKSAEAQWAERYNQTINEQMTERTKAFNKDQIQHDSKKLAQFLEMQRNRLLMLEKQREVVR